MSSNMLTIRLQLRAIKSMWQYAKVSGHWTATFIKRRPFVKYGHGACGRLDEMVVKSVSGKGDVTSRVWMQHAPLATAEMQDLHLPQ